MKANNAELVLGGPGKILVTRSQFEKRSANAIRRINGNLDAEIIVIDDEELRGMSVVEKMNLLN